MPKYSYDYASMSSECSGPLSPLINYGMLAGMHLPDFVIIENSEARPFLMGTPERDLSSLAKAYGGTRESYREETPQHKLVLASYAIGRIPITNAQYAGYVAEAAAPAPVHWHAAQPPEDLLSHPVVNVSWHDAQAFCAWLTQKIRVQLTQRRVDGRLISELRLPSEAEWEQAARGLDGRSFPWGDDWQVGYANTRETGLGRTQAVGSYPEGASPYGCLDLAGTVWEWTSSLDRPYPYDVADGREDEEASGRRILRGGCYANPHGYARCACRFRLPATMQNEFLGFRLAASFE